MRSRKPEARSQKAEECRAAIGRACLSTGLWLLASGFFLLFAAVPVRAQPTQEQVLRSIGQNLDQQTVDPSKLLALLSAAVGLAILLVVLSHRRKRELAPRALHHHGKLVKEISKAISLKPAELRQLKLLAEEQKLCSPLTPLLCPSILDRAASESEGKGDRRVLAALGRRIS